MVERAVADDQPPDGLPSVDGNTIVGLGASAAGIQALKQFFAAVSPTSDMAYVVVLYLSPDHESRLAEVLQQASSVPVTQVRARTRIEPNRVFVIPPNSTLSIADGHIEVAPMNGVEERRAPVDMFFRTLAEAQRNRAVSIIILSGTGANGSTVQEHDTAEEQEQALFDISALLRIGTGHDNEELQAKNEELRATHEQLETRVAERTHELAEANAALRREIDERTRAEETRVRLLQQLARAQEDERRRISRELHDQLGQEVTALGLKLAALKSSPETTDSVRGQIESLQDIVKSLDADVDFLVWELRSTGLDDLGLSDALSDYVVHWSKYFEIPARLEALLEQRLPAELETVLYRIAQEALNNVAKHAHASQVDLVLERQSGFVTLAIRDNGVGFDPLATLESRSIGLTNMRERAGLVGGTVEIESGGRGTTVRVRVPL